MKSVMLSVTITCSNNVQVCVSALRLCCYILAQRNTLTCDVVCMHVCVGVMWHYLIPGSRMRSVRILTILFSERYVRTLTYSILAYVNKNRIRKQTMITEATNWFFATVLINLLFDCLVQNGQFN